MPPSVFVGLQVTGSSMVVQDGREAVLQPGDLAPYDTTRPYILVNENGTHPPALLPRRAQRTRAARRAAGPGHRHPLQPPRPAGRPHPHLSAPPGPALQGPVAGRRLPGRLDQDTAP
ncbi:hypothetical protein O1W17_20680 [Streptomyces sp. H34-S5]|nr:hypothetical protein [Streptomyces sp. H34-S5]MCY0943062.1 hypothetical protein [Streptomyces sp. H34-AA3]MCZ4084423.1 hypothetical protein [Streptomyces sp. H34-S5]